MNKLLKYILLSILIILALWGISKIPSQSSGVKLHIGIVQLRNTAKASQQEVLLAHFNTLLARKIASKEAGKITITKGSFSQLKHAFDKGQIDLLLSTAPSKLNLSSKHLITMPYLYLPNVLLSRINQPLKSLTSLKKQPEIALANDLNVPESLTAVPMKFKRYPANKAVQALEEKKVKGAIISTIDYAALTQSTPQILETLQVNQTIPPITAQKYFGIAKSQSISKINKILEKLHNDDTLAQLSFHYFNQDYTKQ
ncbi:substrate-binding periplasmic protein [Liquorilactobacillus oeni]|nr:transporter substrate-binding domain-containing protein [Liquorilactobacillus oeni]